MNKKKILIGIAPGAKDRMVCALANDFEIMFCDSLEHLWHALHDDFDLVVCGTYFADGCILEMLHHIKAVIRRRTTYIPVLFVRGVSGERPFTTVQVAVDNAISSGAIGFIDLFNWIEKVGEGAALERLRYVINYLLNGTVQMVHLINVEKSDISPFVFQSATI